MSFYLLCITIFIMFFQPVYVFPWLETFQPLRNSAIIALIAYLLASNKSTKSFLNIKTNQYFIYFIIMQIISSVFVWLTGALETFNLWLRMGIVYFLITRSVCNEKQLHMISIVIVLGLTYLSYFSVSEYILFHTPGERAYGFGWYENANDLAIILVSAIPLVLLLVNTSKSNFSRILFMIIAVMFTFNVLITGSRNGLLGLVSVGLLSLFSADRISRTFRSLLLIGLLAAVLTVGINNVLGRSDIQSLMGDNSSENRIVQWKAGVRMIIRHPLLGIGREQFADRAEDFGGIYGMFPHNTLVQVFSETGLPGGIFFVMFAVYPLIEARKYFVSTTYTPSTVADVRSYRFLIAGLVGFWVCAFFSNRYQYYILYVLIALTVAVKENILEKNISELNKDFAKGNLS